jgi:crotonobetainyl-CoA:carnitine CoA-transferase CaiB-like acyl-CoA transferase
LIESALENMTSAEMKIVEGLSGYCAVFKNLEDVFNEPQVEAVQMLEELDHPVAGRIKVTGIPWKLLDTPLKIQGPPPTLGQHTDQILQKLGYSSREINSFRDEKIVA